MSDQLKNELIQRWSYTKEKGLTQWYGHVDYYDSYVIGQWFVLDSETGKEYWSKNLFRANTVRGVKNNVIIAEETRSDGPWTCGFGVYGICAKTGDLIWVSHGNGIWGKLFRYFDYIPGFTNDIRDSIKYVHDQCVVTSRGRTLDISTGNDLKLTAKPQEKKTEDSPQWIFYTKKEIKIGSDKLKGGGSRDDFSICRTNENDEIVWKFNAKDCSLYVEGNYYTFRLHGDEVFIIFGDSPKYIPDPKKPQYVINNPCNYKLGVLNITSGECDFYPLAHSTSIIECRIESIQNSRILISCSGKILTEYEFVKKRRAFIES